MKATGFDMALKAKEEVAVEAALATLEIIQQVMEAQFKPLEALSLEKEMVAKLMKKQAVAPDSAPTDGGTPKPPCNCNCAHCRKYNHKGGYVKY